MISPRCSKWVCFCISDPFPLSLFFVREAGWRSCRSAVGRQLCQPGESRSRFATGGGAPSIFPNPSICLIFLASFRHCAIMSAGAKWVCFCVILIRCAPALEVLRRASGPLLAMLEVGLFLPSRSVASLASERSWPARFSRWLRCENRDGLMRVGARPANGRRSSLDFPEPQHLPDVFGFVSSFRNRERRREVGLFLRLSHPPRPATRGPSRSAQDYFSALPRSSYRRPLNLIV